MRLAIDLGGTHLRVGVGSGVGAWSFTQRRRRLPGLTPQDLASILRQQLVAWEVPLTELDGIGVSAAAVVDRSGHILRAENLGWVDVPLARVLQAAFDTDVRVETDVFCGAGYEAAFGAARDVRAALYIGIGTGVGHAFILDRKVWRGASGRANAIGHMVLWPDERPCYCGNAGCLCTIASGLAQSAASPPSKPLDALARAIGIAATLFDPELVILAGGALHQRWFDLGGLAERLPRFTYPGLSVPRLECSNAPDANLRGAALLPLEDT